MKSRLIWILVVVLMIAAAPAFAEKVSQVWRCEMDEALSEDQVIAMAKEWVKAAKSVKGGENVKSYLRFPVAVTNLEDFDLVYEVVFPTFEEWGRFWDNYSGSEAAKLEDKHSGEGVICPVSSVWEIDSLN